MLKILKFFGVDVCQIVAVTIDNASNMVKLVKLLSAQSESAIDYYVDSEQFEKIPLNEIEVDDSDVLDTDSPEKLVDQEWARVLEDFAPDEFITAVRCGAHTTQLVVHDVCKQSVHKAALREIRKKVKKFRSTEYKTFFDVSEGGTYPPLPNETRWNSDYKMLLELSKGRSFFEKLGTQYPDLGETHSHMICFVRILISSHFYLTDLSNYWGFIEDYVTAFNPLYQCTIAVQKLEHTLSDFYVEWIRAYGIIWELENSNRFKAHLITAMDQRQQKLFCNRIFRAAVYFDPRLNFNGSNLLSAAQKDDVVVRILYNTNPNLNTSMCSPIDVFYWIINVIFFRNFV